MTSLIISISQDAVILNRYLHVHVYKYENKRERDKYHKATQPNTRLELETTFPKKRLHSGMHVRMYDISTTYAVIPLKLYE